MVALRFKYYRGGDRRGIQATSIADLKWTRTHCYILWLNLACHKPGSVFHMSSWPTLFESNFVWAANSHCVFGYTSAYYFVARWYLDGYGGRLRQRQWKLNGKNKFDSGGIYFDMGEIYYGILAWTSRSPWWWSSIQRTNKSTLRPSSKVWFKGHIVAKYCIVWYGMVWYGMVWYGVV